MNRAFLDTNILVYALMKRRGSLVDHRTEIAEQILCAGGVVSVQVLSEFCDVLSRKFRVGWSAIEEGMGAISTFCGTAIPLTAETHKAAFAISRRHQLRIYDSMILAAATMAGCATVYSEDMQNGQMIEGVRIENPFREIS
jgi:predicted nucleic acid-binding protein